MATSPMQPQGMDQKGPAESLDDTGTPDLSGGYSIEIKVSASGKISVGVEPASEEESEGAPTEDDDAAPMEDENFQSVPTMKAACRVAMDIFNNAGQISGASGADQSAMSDGYSDGAA